MRGRKLEAKFDWTERNADCSLEIRKNEEMKDDIVAMQLEDEER